MTTPSILDPACGSRMMYFDKDDPRVCFGDRRSETVEMCDGRTLTVSPQVMADFRALPYADESFRMVILDPPHTYAGVNSWTYAKYGKLYPNWQTDLTLLFMESFRVLKPWGTLILKWGAVRIPLARILALIPYAPVAGTKTRTTTHWVVFLKEGEA